MAVTLSEKLDAAEKDVNRILEELQNAITVDTASQHVELTDAEVEDLLLRINRIETRIQALKYKWQLASRRQS